MIKSHYMVQDTDNFQRDCYKYGYNPGEEMGPSLAQLCEEDEKIEEQGRCMGDDRLLKDNTNKMFRFTILSLQTIS